MLVVLRILIINQRFNYIQSLKFREDSLLYHYRI